MPKKDVYTGSFENSKPHDLVYNNALTYQFISIASNLLTVLKRSCFYEALGNGLINQLFSLQFLKS